MSEPLTFAQIRHLINTKRVRYLWLTYPEVMQTDGGPLKVRPQKVAQDRVTLDYLRDGTWKANTDLYQGFGFEIWLNYWDAYADAIKRDVRRKSVAESAS